MKAIFQSIFPEKSEEVKAKLRNYWVAVTKKKKTLQFKLLIRWSSISHVLQFNYQSLSFETCEYMYTKFLIFMIRVYIHILIYILNWKTILLLIWIGFHHVTISVDESKKNRVSFTFSSSFFESEPCF